MVLQHLLLKLHDSIVFLRTREEGLILVLLVRTYVMDASYGLAVYTCKRVVVNRKHLQG